MSEFMAVRTIEQATDALRSPDAVFLSGGTDLVLEIREGKRVPALLIDISRVVDLRTIEETREAIIVGSALPFEDVARSPLVLKWAGALAEAAACVGSPQIRSVATIGGNIANRSSAADSLPALLALRAEVNLHTPDKTECVSVEELLRRYAVNEQPPCLIGSIRIPKPSGVFESHFIKLGRRKAMAIARMNAAMLVELSLDGSVENLSLAVGAVGLQAYRIGEISKMARSCRFNADLSDAVRSACRSQVTAALGSRKTAGYKTKAIDGLILNLIEEFYAFEQ